MIKKIAFCFGLVVLTLSVYFINFNKESATTIEPSNDTTAKVSSDDNSNILTTDNNSNIPTASTFLDMFNLSLGQLNSESELIVKGKAIEQSYYTAGDQVFSKTKIKIEKVYKGNIKKEDFLNIVEYGGITNEEEYNLKLAEEKTGNKPTEEQKAKARLNKIKILVGGIPYSTIGQSSVYFLQKATTKQFSNQIDNNTYTPIGVQGRFDIKSDNTFERPRGNNDNLPELKTNDLELEKIAKNK